MPAASSLEPFSGRPGLCTRGRAFPFARPGRGVLPIAQIDGGAYGSVVHPFPSPCPLNATNGSFKVELPASGEYNISLELSSGGTLLSETNLLVKNVDCTGTSATPEAPMYVNF